MKRCICILIVLFSIFTLYACGVSNNTSYMRIHIRANSNDVQDQNIKYGVKDMVVEYLSPKVKACNSIDDVKKVVEDHKDTIKCMIDSYLIDNGFGYSCSVSINNEYFPTRTYNDVTLDADYYDAIIIKLGSGEGNNWWCVVYPPLCFTGNNVVYKSKIKELINKYL